MADGNMLNNSANTKLKFLIDILCAIFVAYALIGCPLWLHFYPDRAKGVGHTNNFVLPLQLMLMDVPFAMLGIMWLVFRYGISLQKKYPFITSPSFRNYSPVAIAGIVLVIMFILDKLKE